MIGNATLQYLNTGIAYTSPGASHFVYNIFMSHLLTDPFHIHPVYYSFLITIGSTSLISYWHSKPHYKKFKWSLVFALILLFHIILIYLLKSALFSLLYSVSVVFAFIYQNHQKIFNSKTKLSVAIIGAILMGVFSYKGAKEKLDNFSVDYEVSNEHLSPMMMRFAIWECTWPVIKENLFFGAGVGDQQEKLNEAYKKNNFKILVDNNLQYNTHNQYLQYWLGIGLFGLIGFCILILILLKNAIQSKNIVFIVFAICFSIFSLNESTLQVQKGIVMFSVLTPLFSYLPKFWKF
ncbi:MAG: O-antigen ligase family protein [Salibacteraceae bacterium]